MEASSRFIACLTLASFMLAAPVAAQDSGSMQVGNATVSVGGGTALLTLPDIEFTQRRDNAGGSPFPTIRKDKNNEIDDEIGWHVSGEIETPVSAPGGAFQTAVLKGFYSRIESDDNLICDSVTGAACAYMNIVDNPAARELAVFGGGDDTDVRTQRDVDHWGVALEAKRQISPNVMGVTRAPNRRYLALGADFRAIEQDLKLRAFEIQNTGNTYRYDEDLDTHYYGAYAAYGGDYSLPFIGGMTSGLGLRSSFRVWGGAYYADTDYDGTDRLISVTGVPRDVRANLSLSESDIAFIGGLTLETSKRFGRRATLSLKSEYEYYSWVPEMAYNDTDTGGSCGTNLCQGFNVGTNIGDDDAFSARTSLRLTIKLGPDSVFEEPLK